MIPVLWALGGSMATFGATALGAAFVFFFRRELKKELETIFLGLAAGIMIAALIWSLLLPAIQMSDEAGKPAWQPTCVGFIIGGLLLLLLDHFLPHEHSATGTREGLHAKLGKRTMLVLAVTLHNIPEGFAVGLTFAAAAQGTANHAVTAASAAVLALGMSLQNLPEGAAISLPLYQDGLPRREAFRYGALSGAVEPIAAVVAAVLAETISAALPWLLSIAAGAMMYVVVEELIPEAHLGEHSHKGTFSVMAGFVLMMALELLTA